MTKNENISTIIKKTLDSAETKEIIDCEGFYFKKGQEALQQWLDFNLTEENKSKLEKLVANYDSEIDIALATNNEFLPIVKLLLEIISYCDLNARNKSVYNEYENDRVLAKAGIYMSKWLEKLVEYKENYPSISREAAFNALNYLLDPLHNLTMLREKHRKQVAKNLLHKEYSSDTFLADLKHFFSAYSIETETQNLSHILTRLLYSLDKFWKDEIVGLMAADSTGWQKNRMTEIIGFDAHVIWNSKKPTGGNKTISGLRKKLKSEGYFNLYYSSKGKISYRARIVDFVTSQEELEAAGWSSLYSSIFDRSEQFSNYIDENKKARIVFLADVLEKTLPEPVENFSFFESQSPRQDNLSPIKYDFLENRQKMKSEKMIDLLKSKKQIILQGPPGTGKTWSAERIAKAITTEDKIELIQFHPSYTYEDFVRGIVANIDGTFQAKDKVLAKIAKRATEDDKNDYILIIDEINRANLPSVLGELIYCLEYREKSATSIYPSESDDQDYNLILPPNLFIIGTMNTADRSVGHIDYAIKRRFAFVSVLPDKSIVKEPKAIELFGQVAQLFEDHLSVGFDKDDVQLGHSYFLTDKIDLATRVQYEIVPILTDYVKDGILTTEAHEAITKLSEFE